MSIIREYMSSVFPEDERIQVKYNTWIRFIYVWNYSFAEVL